MAASAATAMIRIWWSNCDLPPHSRTSRMEVRSVNLENDGYEEEATEARKKHISFLQREIDRIYDEYEALGPQRHQFSNDGSPYPSPDRLKEYFAAFKEWKQQNPPPRDVLNNSDS